MSVSSDSEQPTGESKFKKRLSQYDLRIDIDSASGSECPDGRTRRCSLAAGGTDYSDGRRCSLAQMDHGEGRRDSVFMSSSREDIAEQGRELFENFVREEIHKEGLEEHVVRHCFTPVVVSTPQGYKNPLWAKTGRELRAMADAFSKTKERQQVLQKANQVGITSIGYSQFRDLLAEFFLGGGAGITCERIVVLFFFCSDIAIRSLRQHAIDYFKNFIEWTGRFITEKIARWVQENGGWAAVLSSSVQQVPKLLLVVGIAVLSVVLFNWIKRKALLKL